jgi:hypothetical protein
VRGFFAAAARTDSSSASGDAAVVGHTYAQAA